MELRPVLDAIGAGAHRVSEIAGRIGRPATSLSRPLDRLVGMGLVRRDVPFGQSEKSSRRSLYRLADPFFHTWFRIVAPHRSLLATAGDGERRDLLRRYWDRLCAEGWEDLCRLTLSNPARLPKKLAEAGPWGSASRWWHKNLPEWDVIAESSSHKMLLLGECKWSFAPHDPRTLKSLTRTVAQKPAPNVPQTYSQHTTVRVLFVPSVDSGCPRSIGGVHIVTAKELLGLRASRLRRKPG